MGKKDACGEGRRPDKSHDVGDSAPGTTGESTGIPQDGRAQTFEYEEEAEVWFEDED
ncbi:hypothetical protein [Natrarchaeobaculum aegyptiacum]|uniref:hypothetical protein n=1 Tax=Natrarchaeobaculum aegyptiacum TaxID=745377 RepID=UPI0013748163|nr:hypothetical protein [Natrarchaeobaculum aegyptiacum]